MVQDQERIRYMFEVQLNIASMRKVRATTSSERPTTTPDHGVVDTNQNSNGACESSLRLRRGHTEEREVMRGGNHPGSGSYAGGREFCRCGLEIRARITCLPYEHNRKGLLSHPDAGATDSKGKSTLVRSQGARDKRAMEWVTRQGMHGGQWTCSGLYRETALSPVAWARMMQTSRWVVDGALRDATSQ